VAHLKNEIGADAYANGRFKDAIVLFKALSTAKSFEPFLTVPAYRKIL
jgi:malate synthase